MQEKPSETRKPHIVVVGSINMDLVARVRRIPTPGQTVSGHDFAEMHGGKGANQAVAAARMGARCTLIGCVGDDAYGRRLLSGLHSAGTETDRIRRIPNCSSGLAFVNVDDSGENAITVIPGANAHVSPEDILASEAIIQSADILLVQLEIPLPTVEAAIQTARKHAVPSVLDPAPAPSSWPHSLYEVDIICPNVLEAEAITGICITNVESANRAAQMLHTRGIRQVIFTLGEQGAMICQESVTCEHLPAVPINVKDTTGAGDAFAAALCIGLAEEMPLRKAAQLGCAAGAIAASRSGAQPSMPAREEVRTLLQRAR